MLYNSACWTVILFILNFFWFMDAHTYLWLTSVKWVHFPKLGYMSPSLISKVHLNLVLPFIVKKTNDGTKVTYSSSHREHLKRW